MKRLKGPDLKLPDPQVPPALADVYFDLRDRRLLPLVALVVVAIVAVPFLLGDAAKPLPPPPVTGQVGGEETAGANKLTVVEAKPGLRDYRKRLRARTPTDPFKQRYTSLPEEAQLKSTVSSGAGGGGGSSEVSVTDVEESGTEVEETAKPPATGGSPGEVDPGDPGLRFYAFRPDVRFGVAGSGELAGHDNLSLGSMLPKRNPVIVFIGVSENGKRVAFDVSHEVAMVRGPGRCVGGPQSCSLLILKAGQAVDILTGKPDRAFRLKIVRIDFIEVERPKPASSSAARQSWGFDFSQSFIK